MTPQEKELIQNVANKLKNSPDSSKDAEAETLIHNEIGAQKDSVYKLTQAVLVQEMALKELKSKNEYLEKCVEHHKEEAERGTLSRMMGGKRQAPTPPPPPAQSPSAFGSFMQTAAGVAVGMVAGNMISNALFGGDEAPAAESAAAPEEAAAVEEAAPGGEDAGSSFLGDSSGFASEYTEGAGGALEQPELADISTPEPEFASEDSFGDFGDFGDE